MVKTWISGYTDTITTTGVVKPRSRLILFPSFKFKDNALSALSAPKQTLRHIEAYALENDHKMLFHSESKPVTIHPMQIFGKNELGLFLNPNVESPQWWYGAWVTPTADSITQIVAEVAKKLPDGEIKVYQSYYPEFSMAINSKMVVENVFEVLQSRNIKYVQNDGGASLGQRVNYPVETLRKKQGICIETATLFASILERLGFRTRLIFIPDHVFVGWMTDREGNVIDLVESTMIGDPNSTFVDANNAGIEEWQEQIDLGNFDTGKATTVRMEDVRQFGIMPNNVP